MAEEKIRLEEEAISEILVVDTALESGAEASDVEAWFEEEEEKETEDEEKEEEKKMMMMNNSSSSSKPQQN
jgi:hypothetical protein